MRGADFCCHAFFNLCEKNERRIEIMADYKEMYFQLFNKLTDVIEELKEIQCKMEDVYSDDSFVDDEE